MATVNIVNLNYDDNIIVTSLINLSKYYQPKVKVLKSSVSIGLSSSSDVDTDYYPNYD